MCKSCDQEVDDLRPIVDDLLKYVRDAVAANADLTPSQHIIGCANTIIRLHAENDGCMSSDGVQSMAIEYGTLVMRLLALEQMSGISTDA